MIPECHFGDRTILTSSFVQILVHVYVCLVSEVSEENFRSNVHISYLQQNNENDRNLNWFLGSKIIFKKGYTYNVEPTNYVVVSSHR